MIDHLTEWQLMRDLARLRKFALVGGTVAALYVALYTSLRHAGLVHMPANLLAFGACIAVQYVGQASFTFGSRLADGSQIVRFAVMAGTGLAVSTLMTGRIGPSLGWSDTVAAAVVTLMLPVQNFILMSIWVFAGSLPDQKATS